VSAVVDALVAPFDRRDLAAFAAGYADDLVIEDAVGSRLVSGAGNYGRATPRCSR
jgi:hypothetical protein